MTASDPHRSATMRAVKSKNSKAELKVRSLIHNLGFRFRLHRKGLPGTPDIVFAGRRKVIFVHGCFWHGHVCLRGNRIPQSNRDYWIAKIQGNRSRDANNLRELKADGWQVFTIWECEICRLPELAARVRAFLD